MVEVFTRRIVGVWTLVWALSPVAVYGVGLEATGLWAALGQAQSGVPGEAFWLQATPGFSPEQASAALSNVRLAGAEGVAFATYAVDLAFILCTAMGAGALIGFGLRRLGWTRGAAALALLAPLTFCVADLAETGMLAAALGFGLEDNEALMRLASAATAVKFPAFAATVGLALAGLVAGGVAAMVRRGGRTLPSGP